MSDKSIKEFEEGILNNEQYVLKLFITGMTPNSKRAVENLKKICDEFLKGRYSLEIIDIYQQPYLALQEQILAAPTLVKKSPSPTKKMIGDLSDTKKVLLGLGIITKDM